MRRLAKRLFGDKAGNTALIFALLAPLLILAGGGAIDVTNASMRQAQLQQAADAAATAGVSRTSQGFQYALAMPAPGSIPDALTQPNIQAIFNADWRSPGQVSAVSLTGNACGGATMVCRQGTAVISSVVATGTFTTSFLGLISQPTIHLAATAQATANLPTYINYYILVDVSQSMGIAATQADMDALYARVVSAKNGSDGEVGCVFGCHVSAPDTTIGGLQPVTNEQLAHNPLYGTPLTLRIDAAVTAIKSIISLAQNSTGNYNNISIGLYTMSKDPNTGTYVNVVSAPSSNYGALTTAAGTIDLGNNNSGGQGDSDFVDQVTTFNAMLPANGTGVSALSPLNYVFIVTDGLQDSCGSNHCDAAFSYSNCTQLKKKATVGVIYTTYDPIYNLDDPMKGLEANYNRLVQPYVGSIPANLGTGTGTGNASYCASSPSLYFEADHGPDIISAMQKLFNQTLLSDRVSG